MTIHTALSIPGPMPEPAPDEITAPYDRLRALGSYGVLDTAPDAALDSLVQLAAESIQNRGVLLGLV